MASRPERPARQHRPPQRPLGAGGGDAAAWTPAWGWLAIALGLLLVLLFWWWSAQAGAGPAPAVTAAAPIARPAPSAPSAPDGAERSAAAPAPLAAQPQSPAASQARIWRQRDPNGDLTPDLADYVNEGERPTMNEVIARLHAAGVYTGLGAFSPPGTKPPLIGLAVPEDYPLPPGYVRHYQATDDGQRIEAILMYSPDQPPLDAQGQPIAVPANRVVPADQAPAGLPPRQIVLPAPLDAGKTLP